MAPSAITLPVRGDENLSIEEQKKAPKVVRQIDIEGGKTLAKAFLSKLNLSLFQLTFSVNILTISQRGITGKNTHHSSHLST
jgi:Cu/Ag efflux protein CusF